MGILDAFGQWRASRQEIHIAAMKEQNKCPDCNGYGYYTFPVSEFMYYSNPYECAGCNGSGLYSDWEELH